MPSMKIFSRCCSSLLTILVAICGSVALAQEKSFDPTSIEFQHLRPATPKPIKRAKKGVDASPSPRAAPASAQPEESNPSAWSGTYVGGNVGAATGDENNSR